MLHNSKIIAISHTKRLRIVYKVWNMIGIRL